MGLGLSVTASVKPRGFLRRRPTEKHTLRAAQQAVEWAVPDPLLKRLVRGVEEEHLRAVFVHPAAEPLLFSLNGKGDLVCEAQTSAAGPGYHAFVVEVLEQVGPRCEIEWRWTGPEGLGDETQFHGHRNFERLQEAMSNWLRSLARVILDRADQGEVRRKISLPPDYPTVSDCWAMSALGPRTREWFEGIAVADDMALRSYAAEFFPWWERGLTANVWRNCGLALAWARLPWHAPITEDERRDYQSAMACFHRARELAPDVELPEREMAEMQRLLSGKEESIEPPAAEGIGYRRRLMTTDLLGAWTIELPGYYYPGFEEETQLFWFGGRAVRATGFSRDREARGQREDEDLFPGRAEARQAGKEVLEFDAGDMHSWATIERGEERGQAFWQVIARCAVGDDLCLLSVLFVDAQDKDWAVATWRSIRHRKAYSSP